MLVLSRKMGESIVIGDDIRITVVQLNRYQVRIGIEAPRAVVVHRTEVANKIEDEKKDQEKGHEKNGS